MKITYGTLSIVLGKNLIKSLPQIVKIRRMNIKKKVYNLCKNQINKHDLLTLMLQKLKKARYLLIVVTYLCRNKISLITH